MTRPYSGKCSPEMAAKIVALLFFDPNTATVMNGYGKPNLVLQREEDFCLNCGAKISEARLMKALRSCSAECATKTKRCGGVVK